MSQPPSQPPPAAASAIVVGSDFSALADRAIEEALKLASLRDGVDVHVLFVGTARGDSLSLPGDDERTLPEDEAKEAARSHVADVVRAYQKRHGNIALEHVAVYVTTGNPAKQIAGLAAAVDAELVIIGTHGRKGVQRLMLGSVAEAVVRHAPCGVLVIRPSDFLEGEKVPDVQPPLAEGEHSLKHFEHRRTYHYVERISTTPTRIMPAS